MIFVEAPQGTPEWYQARVGKVTASCFADAVSRVGGLDERQAKYVALMRDGMEQKLALAEAGYKAAPTADTVRRALRGEDTSEHSDTAKRYAADLAIERISGKPHGEPAKAWVLERGHEMETRARMLYEARTGEFITEAGICLGDEGIFGYSSDGLAGDDGLIEIKSPIDSIKIMEMWRTGDTSEYDAQMQGGLWLTNRKWLDFIMYVPDLAAAGKDLYVKRILRDEDYIENMVSQLADFDKLVQSYEAIFRAAPETTTEEPMIDIAPDPAPKNEPVLQATLIPPAEELALAQSLPGGTELSPAAQVLNEEEGIKRFAAAHPSINFGDEGKPPSLKLGQIGERIGFTVTADFLLSLGFSPAATEKNSKLFHDADFPRICAAIQRRIAAVQAKYPN